MILNLGIINICNLVILIPHKINIDLKKNIEKIFLEKSNKKYWTNFDFLLVYKLENGNIILLSNQIFKI